VGDAHDEAQMGTGHPLRAPESANDARRSIPDAQLIRRRNRIIVLSSAVVCLAGGIVLGLMSDGVHHDDDLTHFMFARWSWRFPGYLVHVWGRPGFTVPMALVAGWFDRGTAWHVARAASTFVTLAAALIAAGLARKLGLRCWPWVVGLCYLQPLNMVLSFTTLTENFTALYLIASVYLVHRRRFVAASTIFSLVLVTRLETVVLLPVWAFIVWQANSERPHAGRAMALCGVATIWAPVVQNVGHWAFFGTWPVSVYFHPSGSTEYLATGPLAFLSPLMLAATPIVVWLAIVGGLLVIRRGGGPLIALAVVFLVTHWLITWFGLFASGGFARFVVSVAPLLAIAAAAGAEVVADAWQTREFRRIRWIGFAAITLLTMSWLALVIESRAGRLPRGFSALGSIESPRVVFGAFIVLAAAAVVPRRSAARAGAGIAMLLTALISIAQWFVVVRPLRLGPEQLAARDIAATLKTTDSGKPVFAANPWFAWWCGHIENPRALKGPRLLSTMPVGTRFVWDSIYSPSDYHRLRLSDYLSDPAYRKIEERSAGNGGDVRFVVFEKVAVTATADAGPPYPPPLTLGRGRCSGVFYDEEGP